MLKKIFKQKPKLSVGLDIGNSSVKVVQLLTPPHAKTRELVSFDIKSFKAQDRQDIISSIKAVIENAKISTKVINTSVSGQAVIVRYIQMPKMSREDLEKAFKLGIGKYIPFNLDEVNYDFKVLDDGQKTDKKSMRILLVAAKKEAIKERISILQEAGLIPNIIDVDSFAIANSFELISQQNTGAIAVLDIGADITSTTILHNNNPYFSRDVPIGGNHLTKAVVDEFEVSQEEADELKRNPQDRYGDLIGAVKPVLDTLCSELHLSFNYCESQLGEEVNKIFLTGGTAKFKGIDKVLNSILGVDVEIWDPTRILEIDPSLSREQLQDVGPLLTVAVGLALRE